MVSFRTVMEPVGTSFIIPGWRSVDSHIFRHFGPGWPEQLMAYPVLNGGAVLLMAVPCLLPVSEL